MIRFFYVWLLRLHPRCFRQRFAEEMLWIFDQEAAHRGAGPLLADAFLSLVRQRVLRSGFWEQPDITGAVAQGFDGVPVFYTCESSIPRPGALLNGVVLSLAAFGAVYLAIAHGGSHRRLVAPMVASRHPNNSSLLGLPGPAVSSPGGVAGRELGRRPATVGGERKLDRSRPDGIWSRLLLYVGGSAFPESQGQWLRSETPAGRRQPASHGIVKLEQTRNAGLPGHSGDKLAAVYFRVTLVLGALDADHDGVLSASEIANAPAVLRRLDKNRDGKLSPEECGLTIEAMRLDSVLAALDADHNGEISAIEVQNAPAALRALDKNSDGELTADEVLPDPNYR